MPPGHCSMPFLQRQKPPMFGSAQPPPVQASPVVGVAEHMIGVAATLQRQVPSVEGAPACPPPLNGTRQVQVSVMLPITGYVQRVWGVASAMHASPGMAIAGIAGAVAGQPAGFIVAPPAPVPPADMPPVPAVVPVPPAGLPVPPVGLPVPPLGLLVPPPAMVPPLLDDVPPVEDDVPPDDVPPELLDESSLEPPQDAVSAKPPTSIKPKPYFRAFMDSSSGAGVRLGPKLVSLRE